MGTLALKAKLESVLGGPVFSVRQKLKPETASTGIAEVDLLCDGGIPRGSVTEIAGPASSGRTTLFHSILARMTQRGEICALVDASDSFDPVSAAAAGVVLDRLLWVRCSNQEQSYKNNALRVTDLLLQNGGWGMIALDLGNVEPKDVRRIPLNAWHRFRLAVENKPTIFLIIGQEPYATSCSSLVLDTKKVSTRWSGLRMSGAVFQAGRRKPPGHAGASFAAAAWRQVCE